ncbi:MAG: WD40 repeat domain-containing protein [Candidatus Kapaibacterium sp.]
MAQTRTYSVSTIGKHNDEVLGVFVNAANTRFATCSVDETIKIWSLPDGKELRTLSGHLGTVNNLSFSGNDKALASASTDQTVRIWDVESGRQLAVLRGHTAEVSSVYYSQADTGAFIASSGFDRTVKLWDTRVSCANAAKCPPTEVMTLRGHTDVVNGVAYSYDGRYIASCGDDMKIIVWTVSEMFQGKASSFTLEGGAHTAPVLTCLFSFDSQRLISSDKNGVVNVWNLSSRTLERSIKAHDELVQDVTLAEDNTTLITVGLDKVVRMWNITTGEKLYEHQLDTEIWGVDVTSDAKRIVLACSDGTVRMLKEVESKPADRKADKPAKKK